MERATARTIWTPEGRAARLRLTNSMHVQKQLVRAGHGWTILPGVGIAEDVAKGSLCAAPLCEPETWRSIVLGTPRAGRMPAAAVVAKELTRQIHAAAHQGRWPSAQLHGNGPKEA
jgi:LysR family nitrogen assimilation transcriptional regulator